MWAFHDLSVDALSGFGAAPRFFSFRVGEHMRHLVLNYLFFAI